eukprot:1493418-Prymnesium_polylepis.1
MSSDAQNFSASLTHEQLKAYLAVKHAGLEEYLKPHITGMLLLSMERGGMDISRAFSALPDELSAFVIELELLMKSLNKVTKVSEKTRLAELEKAQREETRRKKAEQKGIAGKEPEVQSRTWQDIVKLSENQSRSKSAQLLQTERKRLERDGFTAKFNVPQESKMLANHKFLLGGADEDRISEILSSLGITFESYTRGIESTGKLEVTFSGESLVSFFKEYVDKKGKSFNPRNPVIPVVFWGDHWVNKAAKVSSQRETKLIAVTDVAALGKKRDLEIDALERKFKGELKQKEADLGALKTAVLQASDEQKPFLTQQLASASGLLEGVVHDKAEALKLLRDKWGARIAKREALEAERKRLREQAEEAIIVAKRRKVANIEDGWLRPRR